MAACRSPWWFAVGALVLALWPMAPRACVSAQQAEVTVSPAPAAPAAAAEGAGRRPSRRRGGRYGPPGRPAAVAPAAAQPAPKPDADKAEEDKEQKDADKQKEPSGPEPIQRPATPTTSPDAGELRVKPDKDGRIQFQFRGQKWPDVLAWLADWSGMSLDWQELPGDYLNLTTPRKYTAQEARDLLNQHLLARGYTMLVQDNVLWVCEIENLDPGMVPRVAPKDLAQHDPHEFVKVSFPLDWLVAETAVKELEPMKSPNGKLSALTATNRLEAMDSVTNLCQIYALLTEEQSDDGKQHLFRKFVLRHTRATDVREQLMALLGTEVKQPSRPKTPQEMEQQMRMAQMRAKQAQEAKKKGAVKAKDKPEIYLVAVPRENSILANAPPDKMAVIEQAILAIDVPLDRGNTYRTSVERMHIYRLATIDPEPLVKTLEEIGNLDFNTRLEVDKQNNTIIAYASLPDHVTIRALIEKLDGSARQFYVIQLRRLEADYVAGTIQFMMGGKEEKQPERRRSYYFFGDRRGDGGKQPQEDQFSVDADVENNRLLLRANEDEVRQVEDLLVKLGEIPSQEGDPRTVRLIDAPPEQGFDAWLERIRRTWDGPNRLEVDLPDAPDDVGRRQAPPAPDRAPAAAASQDTTTSLPPVDHRPGSAGRRWLRWSGRRPVRIVPVSEPGSTEAPSGRQGRPLTGPHGTGAEGPEDGPRDRGLSPDAAPADARPDAPPPIKISRAPDGRLFIACEDPRALDHLENLMLEFPPPRKEYEVFKLKYADATYTAMDLRDFFKEEEERSGRRRSYWYYDYYDYNGGRSDSKTPSRLSKRRPLKFIAHVETNSVLVQGATPSQLRTIRELITSVFDRRNPEDANLTRMSKTFKIRYSKASVVAETIKDVYRDLLSANDKALQGGQKGRAERVYNYNFSDNGGMPKKYQFKGAISVGVDEMSNTLLVSAVPQLMDEISQMVEYLDEAAIPSTTVQVLSTGHGVSAAQVQKTLARMLGERSGQSRERSKRTSAEPAERGSQDQGSERRRNGR